MKLCGYTYSMSESVKLLNIYLYRNYIIKQCGKCCLSRWVAEGMYLQEPNSLSAVAGCQDITNFTSLSKSCIPRGCTGHIWGRWKDEMESAKFKVLVLRIHSYFLRMIAAVGGGGDIKVWHSLHFSYLCFKWMSASYEDINLIKVVWLDVFPIINTHTHTNFSYKKKEMRHK